MTSLIVRLIACAIVAICALDVRAVDTIKIAFIGGLSGPSAYQGEEQLKTFYSAAELLNSESDGVAGRKFEIIPFDNKANPQETLIVLRQAIDQDIRYIASTISSVAHAVTDAVSKHNARNPERSVLFLNFNALDPALTEAKCNFWHFRFEVHSDTQVDVLTDFMAKQPSIQKVYLINQDYAYGQSVRRTSREMLNRKRPDFQIVGDELVPLTKIKDFAPYVAKIRSSGADAVLTGNWGNDLSLLIKASNQANLQTTYYTLLGALFGTPSAIGAAGAERVKTVASWHLNATDSVWERRLIQFTRKYKSKSDLAYLPPFRVLEMLGSAMRKAGSQDPVKVALALEGEMYKGPSGDSWMRAEDHQLIAPIYVMSFIKAGQVPIKHDVEGTGYGWRTDALIPAQTIMPPLRCQMERPNTLP